MLYFATTRSEEFAYGTWARERSGRTRAQTEVKPTSAHTTHGSFPDGCPDRSDDEHASITRRLPY